MHVSSDSVLSSCFMTVGLEHVLSLNLSPGGVNFMIHSLQIHGTILSDTNAIKKVTSRFAHYPGRLLQPEC